MLEQFNYSYQNNRSPIGIYLHTPWHVLAVMLHDVAFWLLKVWSALLHY